MKCPLCSVDLKRIRYEEVAVFACEPCNGYLVGTQKVTAIKRRQMNSVDTLKEEALADGAADSRHKLKCPRCRALMHKEFSRPPLSFHLDTCRACQLTWFDAGELACVQIGHLATPKGREAARFQQRHLNMTPEEKQEFEERLAQLPAGDASLATAFARGFLASHRDFCLSWAMHHLRDDLDIC